MLVRGRALVTADLARRLRTTRVGEPRRLCIRFRIFCIVRVNNLMVFRMLLLFSIFRSKLFSVYWCFQIGASYQEKRFKLSTFAKSENRPVLAVNARRLPKAPSELQLPFFQRFQ